MGEMVRRDSLMPGDVAISTHYGQQTVKDVQVYGNGGETTEIVWVFPHEHLKGQPGYEYMANTVWNERYPSDLKIEVVSRAHSEVPNEEALYWDYLNTRGEWAEPAFKRAIAQIRAQAFDQGVMAVKLNGWNVENPYRQGGGS